MSALSANDTSAARRFYGELFGWTTEGFDAGGQEVTMLKLPGFVGGEPQQPVSREVVAVMTPAGPGERAAWAADFWVADLEETAAAAERLGGAVLSPPVEAPPGRSAILADPGGAAFSASQVLVPD